MKKTALIVILFLFILALLPVFAQNQQSGTLQYVKGTVIYKLPGQTAWSALSQKPLDAPVGTIVQTKEDSQALLKFDDGGKILIGEMTLFKIQLREQKENKAIFTIRLFGKTFVEVKSKDSRNSFKIQTPTALATIRGSKMIVEAGNNLITNVTSVEGDIDVAPTYLFKGRVLYIEGAKITLETEAGIRKVTLADDAIIAKKDGSPEVKPNDRIVVYGAITSEQAAAVDLPSGAAKAGLVTSVGGGLMPAGGPAQFMAQPAGTIVSYMPPSPVLPLTVITVAPAIPEITKPAPPGTPKTPDQASTQGTKAAGAPSGEAATGPESGAPATGPEMSPTGGVTGVSGAGAKPGAVTNNPPLVSPSTLEGSVIINAQ